MVDPDEFWPKSAGAIRSITTEIVAAIFVFAFLTSLLIALRVSFACTTLTARELWSIIVSVSAIPTILVGLIIALRMRGLFERIGTAYQELLNLAQIDELTGLLNRTGFDAVAAQAFAETLRSGRPVSALACDIDSFQGLNNRYGHKAGDLALGILVEVLEETIGQRYAVLGRQGGGEFVMLLPGIDLEEAATIAEGLHEVCEARSLVQQDPSAKFTISVGVGTEASSPSELGCLLRQTDAALYRAKRAGGNQVASGPVLCVRRESARQQRPEIQML
jgi:diguanylate cyclase (GGDEF)-like protein